MKKLIPLFLIGSLACASTVTFPAQSVVAKKDKTAAQKQAQKKSDLIDKLWKSSDAAFHAGNYPRAIELHKQIVTLDPHDVESYSDAAWLMWSLGNGDQAQQHIDRGLKANPNNWEMWDAAGQQDDLQKYFSKAQDAYTHALKLIPAKMDSQMLRRRLAHAAENAKDYSTAIKTWEKLVKDYPNDAVNKNNLARVKKLYTIPASSS